MTISPGSPSHRRERSRHGDVLDLLGVRGWCGKPWRVSTDCSARPCVRSRRARPPRLHRVAGSPTRMFGHEPQASHVLDGLVRRAVLAEADRIVRDRRRYRHAHQRRHAQGIARVIGERQEGAADRDEPPCSAMPLTWRPCRIRARRSTDSCPPARRCRAASRTRARQIRAGQIGRAAEQLRQAAARSIQRCQRGLARAPCRRLRGAARSSVAPRGQSSGRSPAMRRSNSAASSGSAAVGGDRSFHARSRAAPRARHPSRRRSSSGLERRVLPAELSRGERDLVVAERRAVVDCRALLVRRARSR